MEVLITGRRLQVTPALRHFVEDRAKKLEKNMGMATQAAFVLRVEKYRHLAEVSVHVNGLLLQAREESEEMYASINRAVGKVFKQFRKYREKITRRRSRPVEEDGWAEEHPVLPPYSARRVAAPPLTLAEALRRMTAQSDDLLVFSDPSTRQIAILRRQGNGQLELLQPVD